MARAACGLALAFLASASVAQVDPFVKLAAESAVVSGDSAYLMGEPIALGESTLSGYWHPEGTFALLVKRPPLQGRALAERIGQPAPPPELSLSIWRKTGKPVDVRIPGFIRIEDVQWLPGSQSALVVGWTLDERNTERAVAATVDGRSGAVWAVQSGSVQNSIAVQPSPTRPVYLFTDYPMATAQTGVVRLVQADGLVIGKWEVPGHPDPVWAPDGNSFASVRRRRGDSGEPATLEYWIVELSSGRHRTQATAPAWWNQAFRHEPAKPPEGPIRLQWAKAPGDVANSIVYLMSPTDDSPKLAQVCLEANWAVLSPNHDFVLYGARGVAMARSIAKVPKTALEKARDELLRQEIMSRAKQMGTAFLIYAADHSQVLPSSAEFSLETIYPYIKNREIMSGFQYTFAGGALYQIGDPSKVELGYILGPGGRAVVYMDSHVRWEANP